MKNLSNVDDDMKKVGKHCLRERERHSSIELKQRQCYARENNSLTSGCQKVLNDLVNKVTREAHIENTAHSAGVHARTNDSCLHWEPVSSCRQSYRL